MSFRRCSGFCTLLLTCSMVPAQDAPTTKTNQSAPAKKRDIGAEKAREILGKADAALKKIKAVKYVLRAYRIDVPEDQASKMSGPVIVSGWNAKTELPERFRYEVTTRPAGRTDTATIVVGCDTEQYWALNLRDKKAFTGAKLSSVGPYQALIDLFPIKEFSLPEPLRDELRAEIIELMGQADVGGEDCYKIRVAYSGSRQSATWYLSTKDYLPRRIDRVLVDPVGDTMSRASFISDIVVDPELPDDVFRLVIPADFVKSSGSWP